ncbi:unnamed protein product [Peniophora sp. CBMAI 1063]|nr:unnamed protein product [Peniophora sp. CBMAI 1063]
MENFTSASDALMRDGRKGVNALHAQLKDQKKQTREKKAQCGNASCQKEEEVGKALLADWKNHKKSCTSFSDPPLCHLFDPKRKIAGCSYVEHPVFARGTQDGMGCWATPHGSVTGELARKPGNALTNLPSKGNTYDLMLHMMPGIPGSWFDIRLMVQNRTKGPMLLLGSEIVAVIKDSHRKDFLGGIRDGETHLPAKELNGTATIAQPPSYVDITALNGKTVKEGGEVVKDKPLRDAYSTALIDGDSCAVLLQPAEHAILEVQFRLGGIQEVSREFHAWAMLDHFVIPCLPYSTTLSGSFRGVSRHTDKDVQASLVNMRAPIIHKDVDNWYHDFVTRGERAHVAQMMQMLMGMAMNKT